MQENDPTFIFLSEPWVHLADTPLATDQLESSYNFYLNSEDRHDDLLSLQKTRAHGGTMTLWKKELDPYITIIEPSSSRVLAMVLDKPGHQISIHINIYLHTAGKDPEFLQDLAILEETIEDAIEKYLDAVVYIRGDANAAIPSRKNNPRDELFQHFLQNNNLLHLPTDHKTYHHFLDNGGISDSNIDVILQSKVTSEGFPNECEETLLQIICSKTNPWVDSSHDVLLSSVNFPWISAPPSHTSENITAPRVASTKHKIDWSEEGIVAYQDLLKHTLPSLQLDDNDDLQAGSASLLFQVTNHILSSAARHTNKVIDLSKAPKHRTVKTPPDIAAALKEKAAAHKSFVSATKDPMISPEDLIKAKEAFKEAKAWWSAWWSENIM